MEDFKFPELILEQTLYTLDQLKNAGQGLAHIALAGRSNVGKSSLINALAKRKQLAKVSATPGKTRSVNLYRVAKQDLYLTDLPGYGYAKRSKSERELWGNLIEKYLLECENLAAIAILLDCRLDPQEADIIMVQFAINHNIPIIPILTKADKCTQTLRHQRQSQWAVMIRDELALPVSAMTGLGLAELWQTLIASANEFNQAHDFHTEENTIQDSNITENNTDETNNEQKPVLDDGIVQKTKIRTKRGAFAKEKQENAQAQKLKEKRKAQAEKNRQKHKKNKN